MQGSLSPFHARCSDPGTASPRHAEPLPGRGCPRQGLWMYPVPCGAAARLRFGWEICACFSLRSKAQGKAGSGQGNENIHFLKIGRWECRNRGVGASAHCQPLVFNSRFPRGYLASAAISPCQAGLLHSGSWGEREGNGEGRLFSKHGKGKLPLSPARVEIRGNAICSPGSFCWLCRVFSQHKPWLPVFVS